MKTSEILTNGEIYTRKQLQSMFKITDATINTGIFRPPGHDSIWLFVTQHKTSDRTQYTDYFSDENTLHWDGQTAGRKDYLIVNHGEQGLELLLFFRPRKDQYPGYGFKNEGSFEYRSHTGKKPSHFVLCRASSIEATVILDLEAMEAEQETFSEGSKKQRFVNYFERNSKLRSAAISHHGTKCMGCGFDFEEYYGEHGAGYIEVHHLTPVSTLGEHSRIDPKIDMAVVCSNCHRMIHRRKDDILSLEELRAIIRTG